MIETLTRIGHALFGFISTLAVMVHPVLPALSLILFIVYELDESWRLNDEAYEEIREYGYGVASALLALLILKLAGVCI